MVFAANYWVNDLDRNAWVDNTFDVFVMAIVTVGAVWSLAELKR